MVLLDWRISGNRVGLTVLRSVMLLDLLALMAAFAAGSCHDVVASICVSVLFGLVFAYVAVHVYAKTRREKILMDSCAWRSPEEEKRLKKRPKFLLLLTTFATPLAYGDGLVPPGGFWSETRAAGRGTAPTPAPRCCTTGPMRSDTTPSSKALPLLQSVE
uniref:Uncharacterized protein n=1 Tax=Aegilops tauschii TaxID=37682 RepID=R7WE31_AEGTA